MKRLFLLFAALFSLNVYAQSSSNVIFRNYENYQYSHTERQFDWDMNNISTRQENGNLIISFKASYKNGNEVPPYYYTFTINLRRSKVINGYWRDYTDRYGFTHFSQVGNEALITFSGDIRRRLVIPKYNSDKTESCNEFYILCPTGSEANRILQMILDCQKPFKEPEPQYKIEESVVINNPYSNINSSELFKIIKNYFETYQTNSETGIYEAAETNNLKVSFKYPHLIFDFQDSYRKGIMSSSSINKNALGKVSLMIPISSTTVRYRNSVIVFSSTTGIDHTLNGKRNLIKEYGFYTSSMITEDLCYAIQEFFKKVQEEGYTGSYGVASVKPQSTSSTNADINKNISDKFGL